MAVGKTIRLDHNIVQYTSFECRTFNKHFVVCLHSPRAECEFMKTNRLISNERQWDNTVHNTMAKMKRNE